MNFEIHEIVVNCILFKLNDKYSFPFMNKNASVKFCIPPLACPSANPCNPCHRSGIQHEKTTGTATAMETEEKNLIVHNCIRYNYWRKGEMKDIYMLSLSTENHYGIFSNYRMFVCPS